MSEPQPDVAYQLADALLGHIVDRLTELDAAPKRAYVCADVGVPSDDCCAGTVWVRVASIIPTDGSTNPMRQLVSAGTGTPSGHAILLEAGALRCAPVIDRKGRPPSVDAMRETALNTARDRDAIRKAVVCDFADDIDQLGCDGQVPAPWLPLFTGECAGGYLTTQVVTTLTM